MKTVGILYSTRGKTELATQEFIESGHVFVDRLVDIGTVAGFTVWDLIEDGDPADGDTTLDLIVLVRHPGAVGDPHTAAAKALYGVPVLLAARFKDPPALTDAILKQLGLPSDWTSEIGDFYDETF